MSEKRIAAFAKLHGILHHEDAYGFNHGYDVAWDDQQKRIDILKDLILEFLQTKPCCDTFSAKVVNLDHDVRAKLKELDE